MTLCGFHSLLTLVCRLKTKSFICSLSPSRCRKRLNKPLARLRGPEFGLSGSSACFRLVLLCLRFKDTWRYLNLFYSIIITILLFSFLSLVLERWQEMRAEAQGASRLTTGCVVTHGRHLQETLMSLITFKHKKHQINDWVLYEQIKK